jgi:hypothetical protein
MKPFDTHEIAGWMSLKIWFERNIEMKILALN